MLFSLHLGSLSLGERKILIPLRLKAVGHNLRWREGTQILPVGVSQPPNEESSFPQKGEVQALLGRAWLVDHLDDREGDDVLYWWMCWTLAP